MIAQIDDLSTSKLLILQKFFSACKLLILQKFFQLFRKIFFKKIPCQEANAKDYDFAHDLPLVSLRQILLVVLPFTVVYKSPFP